MPRYSITAIHYRNLARLKLNLKLFSLSLVLDFNGVILLKN